jgi:DNA-binding NarL/FixJ family response regulator
MARKMRPVGRRSVEVISPHPLVLRELTQALSTDRFRLRRRRVEASPSRPAHEPSRALLYVVDAEVPRPTVATIVTTIQNRFPKGRILVVAERFAERDAVSFLRLGVKGLVRYQELREKLPVALETVAEGGFWAPRTLVSRFMDELTTQKRRSYPLPGPSTLTVREREVLGLVLENLSNKEIASRLHISERTVKFHVSNLLAKFQAKGRQELLLQCLSSDRPLPASGVRDR